MKASENELAIYMYTVPWKTLAAGNPFCAALSLEFLTGQPRGYILVHSWVDILDVIRGKKNQEGAKRMEAVCQTDCKRKHKRESK